MLCLCHCALVSLAVQRLPSSALHMLGVLLLRALGPPAEIASHVASECTSGSVPASGDRCCKATAADAQQP